MDAVAIVMLFMSFTGLIGGFYCCVAIARSEVTLRKLWLVLATLVLLYALGFLGYWNFRHNQLSSSEAISLVSVYFVGSLFIAIITTTCLNTIKSIRKVAALNAQNKILSYIAHHDHLTGVYNRFYLIAELNKLIIQIQRNGSPASLLFIDLDGFKTINDSLGHLAGDYLLKQVAHIFQKRCRKTDVVARYGGDEFVIVLYHTELTQAYEVAQIICDELTNTIHYYHHHPINLHCCIGIAPITALTQSAEDAITRADHAVYMAKSSKNPRIQIADESLDQKA